MYKLRYLSQAKDDLLEIKRYIARESGSQRIAFQFTHKIREQCQRLAELPGHIGRPRPELREGLRSFTYGNYVIFIRYNDNTLEVITIIEGHRDVEALFERPTDD